MGSMSASDAAPLPRLGEVYFDVRGESRSMRLSWYADTGVAVFSIWQGGTCTGTFRLPIADLPRMVEALQRGPHGEARDPRDARGTTEQHPTTAYHEDQGAEYRRTGAHGRYDEEEARPGYGEDGLPGGYRSETGGGYPAPGGYEDEPTGVYRGDVLSHGYLDEPGARHREADYPDDPLTGRYPVEDPPPPRYPADEPHRPRHPEGDPHPTRYRGDDPHRPRYEDDPLTGCYREDPHPSRYPEDPHPSRYPEDPLTGDRPDGPHTGDYPTGPATAGYPDGPAAYSEDSAGYPDDSSGYPDHAAGRDYPASPGNAGYSPARPYVTPVPGGTGPAVEGRGHGRRRAADREESDPSADSFPYGRPPAEPEARRRER
jgi:hypothetical protein